jgi:hypothetical protein
VQVQALDFINEKRPHERILNQIIKENLNSYFQQLEQRERYLPAHIKREFLKLKDCGNLNRGFVRVHCYHCNKDKLVGFSCKGRTLCPSCNGRRMNDTAAHLSDHVFPKTNIRQWVMSFPFQLRYLMAYNSKLQSSILSIFIRTINSHYKRKAKKQQIIDPQVGSVTVIQRFGGSLNLNVHFHTIFIDGVISNKEFHQFAPDDEAVKALILKIKTRVIRHLKRKGYMQEPDDLPENQLLQDYPELSNSLSASIENKFKDGQRPKQINKLYSPKWEPPEGRRMAYLDGFSLHANVHLGPRNQEGRERLFRYIARPAISHKRLFITKEGNIRYQLKNHWRDGTSELEFPPEKLLDRLVSLVPPPMMNLTRYHGVFAPNYKKRKEVIPKQKEKKLTSKDTKRKDYRTPWAELLKRVFKIDILQCRKCHNKMDLMETVTSPKIIEKILKALNLNEPDTTLDPARGPPETDEFAEEYQDYDDWC